VKKKALQVWSADFRFNGRTHFLGYCDDQKEDVVLYRRHADMAKADLVLLFNSQ
jgi:hypothetical protein